MGDLRYAVRVLRKSPAFAAVAIATLSLCIGANTAIFSIVDRLLLRPLPYPSPERLTEVVTKFAERPDADAVDGATWEALRDAVTTVEVGAMGGRHGVNLVAGAAARYVHQLPVTAGFFHTLGVAPALGREFTAEEDREGGPLAVVLSDELWRSLGSDASLVGRSLIVRGEPHQVVGVMPAGFTTGEPVDAWTPLRPSTSGAGGGQNYEMIARLRDGVTVAQATAEVMALGQKVVDATYPATFKPRLALVPLQAAETDAVRQTIYLLWSAVGIVLLIGCVNIAGLLMTRGFRRAPEIATRLAIGGSRATIVRQLLIESLVLAACGAVGGLVVGMISARVFAVWLQDAFGISQVPALDLRVLAVTAAIAIAASLAFGLWPAVQASRVSLRDALVSSGSPSIAGAGRGRSRRLLVVTEVALGVVLLVGAGLLIRSFDHLRRLPPGFDGTHVLTATASLEDARYRTVERVSALFDRTLERMRAIPGVENAAVALTLPYERALNDGFRWPSDARSTSTNVTYVTAGYFETLRIPLVRGRFLDASDRDGRALAIVVNQAFVRQHSSGVDPIGRVVMMGSTARTIVGVVGDVQTKRAFGRFGPVSTAPAIFMPAAQAADRMMAIVHVWFSPSWFVRSAGPQDRVAAAMQQAVREVDPFLPFAAFRTLDDVRGEALATPRAQASLLGLLSGLALLLVAIGLYGLVANTVASRTRELGIRLALGAPIRRVIAIAVLPGAALAATGVVVGLIAARAGAATMRHLVWGIEVTDALTFLTAGTVVLIVAVVAALIPAARIARLNPVKALRES